MALPSRRQMQRPTDYAILVMTHLADLYATLEPETRRAVHAFMGTRLDSLPTLAEVQPRDSEEEQVLPFHRDREAPGGTEAAE